MDIAGIGNDIKQRLSVIAGLRDRLPRGALAAVAIVVAVIVLLYYPVGMILVNKVDDDLDFTAATPAEAVGSHAVAVAAALVEREIDENRWTANDPFFLPSAALDNMPNFQQGIVAAVGRFAFELTDQLGRTRGSSQTDTELQKAAGLLQYSGTTWVWDASVSLMPTAAAEEQYREAVAQLRSYNERLAQGKAVFEKRSDNLLATLDRIAVDLGSSSAALDRHISERAGGWIDFEADDRFYGVKGQTYAYYLLLRDLGRDFEVLIGERGLDKAWAQMLDSIRKTAALDPTVVVNGAPDGQIMPSHLAAQGFFLLRARTQLREITNILLK